MARNSSLVLQRAFVAFVSFLLGSLVFAQGIPDDRNINIIGVNPPTVSNAVPDVGLKQQNEPSCAMKPSNPLQILCAFNDYRGVDNPIIGDAWEGYAYSINGGQTWFSDLLPGHPGDAVSLGLSFAADPQVVIAPGIALVSYIAADRGEGATGGLFLQRMFEVNREAGAPWVPDGGPIPVVIGDADSFVDKPFTLLHPAPAGSGTVTVESMLAGGSQIVPAARLFIAYTVFSGSVEADDLMSKILLARSDDYGTTWETAVLANSTCELPGKGHCKQKGKGHKKGKGRGHSKRADVIQSASIAANGDNVCAVWRRFEDGDQPDAIMASCSSDRGETFAIAGELSVVPEFFPFDQGTSESSFRTNSYPVITSDGNEFYAFWTSRIATATPFFSRILYSRTTDGTNWTTPVMLEDAVNGHQFMPTATAARGAIQLAWYDTRNNLFQADFISDRPGDGNIPDEDSNKMIRNQGDVRTAQIVAGIATHSVQVSRYIEGALVVDGPVQQLEFNFMNDRLFKQGTVPFDGDYPHIAAPAWRFENDNWISNISATTDNKPTDFLVTWTDNRDVRGNVWNDLVVPTVYTPADMTSAMAAPETESSAQTNTRRADAEPDPTDDYGFCVPGTHSDRSRNQNVYSSVVRPGVSIDSPSSSKPTGAIQRAHVIWVSNNESTTETYTLTIDNQPPDAGANGRASFLQVPVAPFADDTGLLTEIVVNIDANSTVARTIYVTSVITTEPEIGVSISDGGSIVFGTITLNGDVLSPDVQNPDVQNPDVQNPDIQNEEVHNPDVQNVVITRVQNPDVQNPDVQNPDVQNPDVQNPDVQNPDVQNPDIQNPDVQNTSLDGSNTENPDVANDDLTQAEKDAGYTDITHEITNDGNTTTSFNLDAFINGETAGLKTQLIATRTHTTETSRDCVSGKLVQNQVIFNEINPDLSVFSGNSDDGVFGDGSAYIAPGETIYVTLRVWGDPLVFDAEQAGVRVQSQSCDSVDKTAGTTDCDPPQEQVNPTATVADIDFELNLAVSDTIIPINRQLERYGVRWEEQDGVLRMSNEGDSGSFAGLSGSYLAYNSFDATGSLDGTHTARFVCPDGSGKLATVDSASINVSDTEAAPNPRVSASSYNINGGFLETSNLSALTGTLNFTAGPIASIVFTDSGGDGHLLDNMSYQGRQCVDDAVFTQTVISGDSSILSGGSQLVANNMNGAAATVNGVAFGTDQSGFSSPTPATGAWLFSGGDFSTDPFTLALDSLLSANQFVPFGQTHGELAIAGLTPGTQYRLQLLFSNDLNTTANNIEVTVEGSTWILDSWQPAAINLLVDFTASGSSVVVEFDAGASATSESGRGILSGYALHGPNIIE